MIGTAAAADVMPEEERIVAEVGVGESERTESGGGRLTDRIRRSAVRRDGFLRRTMAFGSAAAVASTASPRSVRVRSARTR
jgi:hypothetical protein